MSRSYQKFYSRVEVRFYDTVKVVQSVEKETALWIKEWVLDKWIRPLVRKANSFVAVVDEWYELGLVENWQQKDATHLWMRVINFVYQRHQPTLFQRWPLSHEVITQSQVLVIELILPSGHGRWSRTPSPPILVQ